LYDSIFTRLVAWSIAICTAVVLILGILVSAKFEQLMTAGQEWALNADIENFREVYASGGRQALLSRIDERLDDIPQAGTAPHYLLVDADGQYVAGDLQAWPQANANGTNTRAIALANGHEALARTTWISPDLRLLVARESSLSAMILNQIGTAFVLGGLFVVLAVGVAGRMTAMRLAKRIHRINEAFLHPDEHRLEILGRGRNASDEIGELTRHSGAALQRLNALVDAHRDNIDQIAHEMRTPLMHLDSRLLRALRDAPDDATARGLNEARGEIRTVISMLESLLDISQNEAHRGDPRGLERVDLSELVENLAQIYEASAEESGHRFEWEIAPGVVFACEEMQMTRLVTNLLDNAFKYVPSGGSVVLTLQPGPVITVADTGPGVPAAEHKTIFERFQRGGNKGDNGGSGLGLALARAIARRHGLDLRLMPTLRGACFRVEPETESEEA